MSLHVGIDIGGTFTDLLAVDQQGRSWRAKVTSDVTNPKSLLDSVIDAVGELSGEPVTAISTVTLGHTTALNALIESDTARTALVTTRGFRDVLVIGRESRVRAFDLQQDQRPSPVPRDLCYEIDERVMSDGSVYREVDKASVTAVARKLKDAGVEAVSICLIHSYANPAHERLVRDLLSEELTDVDFCISSDVLAEHREFERTLVTTLNAMVLPRVRAFTNEFQESLTGRAPGAVLFVADSAGGAMVAHQAQHRALNSALSGPALGVRAAAALGDQLGCGNLLTLDIGGTSCDVGLVWESRVELTNRSTLAEYPVALRSVDVHAVTAGGGSIAWLDDGGLLRVGPRSSGAFPGPVCYDRGGTQPTVTDAHLVLGHLGPDPRIGQDLTLNVPRAREAILRELGTPLGLSAEEIAAGILRIVDAEMIRALERISVSRGYDYRETALVAYGGAGPMHAAGLFDELGMQSVIIPADAGVFCALGALSADERYEYSQSVNLALNMVGADEALRTWAWRLRDRAAETQPDTEGFCFDYWAELRYIGQTSTLTVELDAVLDRAAVRRAEDEFKATYERVFGYGMQRDVEVEALRLVVRRPRQVTQLEPSYAETRHEMEWRAHFGEGYGFQSCSYVAAGRERPGARIDGPAIIDNGTSTTLLLPGQVGVYSAAGALVVENVDGASPSPITKMEEG